MSSSKCRAAASAEQQQVRRLNDEAVHQAAADRAVARVAGRLLRAAALLHMMACYDGMMAWYDGMI